MARTRAQLGKRSGLGAKSDKVDLPHHFQLLHVLPSQEFTRLRGGGLRDERACTVLFHAGEQFFGRWFLRPAYGLKMHLMLHQA